MGLSSRLEPVVTTVGSRSAQAVRRLYKSANTHAWRGLLSTTTATRWHVQCMCAACALYVRRCFAQAHASRARRRAERRRGRSLSLGRPVPLAASVPGRRAFLLCVLVLAVVAASPLLARALSPALSPTPPRPYVMLLLSPSPCAASMPPQCFCGSSVSP